MKKAIRTTAAVVGSAGAAYIGFGALANYLALSRRAVNKRPEDPMSLKENRDRYNMDENYRRAEDWYISHAPCDEVLLNKDGDVIHADIIKQPDFSHKWLVVNHGYTSRPRTMALQGVHFYEKGYNVLMPYMRGHRLSGHKACTMGYFDRYDVCCWIDYIVNLDADAEIVVMGCSMGAATTMLVTGEPLPSNVKCAVEDCGYTSVWDEFSAQIGNILHLPAFPFLNAANSWSKYVCGWDYKDCSPLEAVKRSVTPTLFIHGRADDFVPFEMLHTLYDACRAEKDILEVEGAGHDRSCALHPEIYWPKIDGFVERFVK